MGENKDNNSRKQAGPAREWLSDNLRYLILIGVIIVAVIAAIFIVMAVRKNISEKNAAGSSEVSASAEEVQRSAPAVSETSEESVESVSEETAASEESVSAVSESEEVDPAQGLTEDSGEAVRVINDYYKNLLASDENTLIDSYSDIQVYTYPGQLQNEYIAFAEYTYKYKGYDAEIPALTEFYLWPDENDQLVIVEDIPSDVLDYIHEAEKMDAVETLVVQAQNNYQYVMDSNPELKEYIDSLDEPQE